MEEKQSNGLAIASMVLGIVSLILTCILPYVSWVLAIVGIVLAAIAKKKGKIRNGYSWSCMLYHRISSMGSSYYFAGSSWCICRIGRIKKKRTAGGELQKAVCRCCFSCSVLIEGGRMMNEEMNNSYYGNNTQGNPNPVPQPEPGKPSGYSIASMVLGICSIVTCCLYGVRESFAELLPAFLQKKKTIWVMPTVLRRRV